MSRKLMESSNVRGSFVLGDENGVLSEDDIHEAFVAQHECTLFADLHIYLLDINHLDYMPGYAAAFRKFRFSHKTIPDYVDEYSRMLGTLLIHRQMVDIRHANYDAEYNFAFHDHQERKGNIQRALIQSV